MTNQRWEVTRNDLFLLGMVFVFILLLVGMFGAIVILAGGPDSSPTALPSPSA